MTPTRDDIVLLIRRQTSDMQYVTKEGNSLRLGHLRNLATRLIELIDAMPEKERTNTTGMEEGE